MGKLVLNSSTIQYENHQTSQCPIKISEHLYIEAVSLPRYFIATISMSFYAYYHADCPEFMEKEYKLSENFQKIIQRFPHTNEKQVAFDGTTYQFKCIPIVIHPYTYIQAKVFPDQYPACLAEIDKIQDLLPFNEQVEEQFIGKPKELLLNGCYGKRMNIVESTNANEIKIQEKLCYMNEMYSFAHYSYAAMIEFLPEYEIATYTQFHEAYGHAIYSVMITKNQQKIPLLWPDYLYHKPENHLEFGILASDVGTRYAAFNDWKEGDSVTVEILADGFEDVHFETILKRPLKTTPKLSKIEYILGETIEIELTTEIIAELLSGKAEFEIVFPKRKKVSGMCLSYEAVGDHLRIPSAQLEDQGRFQLKVLSERYGQLLLLFTLRKDKIK